MANDLLFRKQLAAAAEVNIETLRYYEQIGLIPTPARNSSGYRLYPRETATTLRLIRNAQKCGFSLEEIRRIIRLFVDDPNCFANGEEIIDHKLAEIDQKILELQNMIGLLSSIKKDLQAQICPELE
jgi:DNA-binding transcriptional MerR regulator